MSESIHFPKNSTKSDEILSLMKDYKSDDVDWKKGRSFSLVYPVSDDHHEFLQKAHNMFFSENALNPMAFKSLRRFEHETIRMVSDLFHGGDEAVGLVTSGGTESLIMAIKAYRDRARKLKPWIRRPEMIIPETAHSAIDKGAYYFDVKVRHAPIGPDFRVDLKAVKKLINRNTILIVGSAPQYPQGVVDPISQLGEIALSHKIPLHVDACIGGFVLPFIERLGYPVPVFDFRVPGVTSISADIHKYGYAAKGASALIYRDMSYMKHQFFVHTEWKGGGIYASPSFPGTRPGGPIAAAWATLKKLGEEGYLDLTKKVLKAREIFLEELSKIPELKLQAYPDSTLVSFVSVDPQIGIYAVADQLQAKGWNVTRQQTPESLHLTLSPAHLGFIEEFIRDLKEAVAVVKANPKLNTTGQAAMYGMMAKIPFKGMIKTSVQGIMEKMYGANNQSIDSKTGEVESWGDFIEKMGSNALEVKRHVDEAWSKVKDQFSKN
jgi:glutamate/tyrosine decarboxylase-like PLP-dependent enzyme